MYGRVNKHDERVSVHRVEILCSTIVDSKLLYRCILMHKICHGNSGNII